MHTVAGLLARLVGIGGIQTNSSSRSTTLFSESCVKGYQLSFPTASLVDYSDFRLNIRYRGSSLHRGFTSAFHWKKSNHYNKSFILCHSQHFFLSDWTLTVRLGGDFGCSDDLEETWKTSQHLFYPRKLVYAKRLTGDWFRAELIQFKPMRCKKKLVWGFWK